MTVSTLDTDVLVAGTEQRRVRVGEDLPCHKRAELGQFFTPSRAAALIASLPRLPASGTLRVLDPGAGVGSLTAALVARVLTEAPHLNVEVAAVEVDPSLEPHLRQTLTDCASAARSADSQITLGAITADFISQASGMARVEGPLAAPFDLVIMNPPYRKLGAQAPERRALATEGVDCPNIYCAFLALGTILLKPGGQLVAITPRSFANGPYFANFRHFFLRHMSLDRIHVFESRSTVFADADVLQENIIFSATRANPNGSVTLSASRGHTDESATRTVAYTEVIKPGDPHRFLHIPAAHDDDHTAGLMTAVPGRLSSLGLQVSTGRVVDFRTRDYLLEQPSNGSVPLIYPGNLRAGRVHWPLAIRKPQAVLKCPETAKLILPSGHYVVVKRFSAKEERRRVVAVVCDPRDLPGGGIGFENHLNVYHEQQQGLADDIARGLCLWLNSTILDTFFRTFSGHTQVNATDLRSLPYPSRQQLIQLSNALGDGSWPGQEEIDRLIARHVLLGEQFS